MVQMKLYYDSIVQGIIDEMQNIQWSKEALPNTSQSVESAARYVQNLWSGYLTGDVALKGIGVIDEPNGKLAKDIHTVRTGDFSSQIYSDNPKISAIQEGEKMVFYDMKKTHPYGRKSRISYNKDGSINSYYLIIPFRWGTPNGHGTQRSHFNNVIPEAEYKTNVLPMQMTERIQKVHYEKNAQGINVLRSEYDWGSRLSQKKGTAWDDRSEGLIRSIGYQWSSNGKIKATSTYFTFRIISSKSKENSWLYRKPGKLGKDMMGALMETAKDNVISIISDGIKKDLT